MSNKVDILGVKVDSLTMQEAIERVENFFEERRPVIVATANAEMLMRATHDEELKKILNANAQMKQPKTTIKKRFIFIIYPFK